MEEYHTQSITVVIEKESELYRRIVAYAAKHGMEVEGVVRMLISVGSIPLMEERMSILESLT